MPVALIVAEGIDGFCDEEVNPFGPVHEYVKLVAVDDEVRLRVEPAQTGPLLLAEGDAGERQLIT